MDRRKLKFLLAAIYFGLVTIGAIINVPLIIDNYEEATVQTYYQILREDYTLQRRGNDPVGVGCVSDTQCGHGTCIYTNLAQTESKCQCDSDYRSIDGICDYRLKNRLVVFLVSFFVGGLGVDWFILARGNAGYIVAGVFKLLTLGGCCVWATVDWIRIAAGGFPDGNGIAMTDF